MTSGTVLAGQTNANNTNDDCATAGADTGALTVTVTAANANGVSGDPGTYTDTLVVLVAAE